MGEGKSFIFMGVSGTGKTSIGTEVAHRLGVKLIDGDDLHTRENIIKMRSGLPLNDKDREPWLMRVRDAAYSLEQKNEVGIIICSALKKKYRDVLRDGNKNLRFLFLRGSFELIFERMLQRQGHFMKAEMLKSQFAILQEPTPSETDVIMINIQDSFDNVVMHCIRVLRPLI